MSTFGTRLIRLISVHVDLVLQLILVHGENLDENLSEFGTEKAIACKVECEIANKQELGDHDAILIQGRGAHGFDLGTNQTLNDMQNKSRKLTNEKEKHNGDEHDCDVHAGRA